MHPKTKRRNISDGIKKYVAGKQYFKCINKPGSKLRGLEGYDCPLWKLSDPLIRGNFDESCYEIDHIVEVALGGNNDIENLQALCLSCHAVKTRKFQMGINLSDIKCHNNLTKPKVIDLTQDDPENNQTVPIKPPIIDLTHEIDIQEIDITDLLKPNANYKIILPRLSKFDLTCLSVFIGYPIKTKEEMIKKLTKYCNSHLKSFQDSLKTKRQYEAIRLCGLNHYVCTNHKSVLNLLNKKTMGYCVDCNQRTNIRIIENPLYDALML